MFRATRPSSGAIEYIISFTNVAYGVLGVARCLEERARRWRVESDRATHHRRARSSRHLATPRTPYATFVKEIIYSIAPEDGRVARNMSS